MSDKMLSTSEAAGVLGVSPWTLVDWRRTTAVHSPVPFTRIGGRVRYHLSDLELILARRERQILPPRERYPLREVIDAGSSPLTQAQAA